MRTTSIQPITGSGHFQWNTGGWFGSALGSTVWMLVAAVSVATVQPAAAAAVPLVAFLVVNVVAIFLWNKRDRIEPFRGIMLLLGTLAIAVPAVYFSLDAFAPEAAKQKMNWISSPFVAAAIVLGVPAMMLWFTFLERRAVADKIQNRSHVDSNPEETA